ncbi:YggS family pyridoxal phosphate-dependent enzyme [Pelagibacteraceae bacterium]|nr:YggS family pyridoxal phosphate-dependent enzyme [Pelagibacteraceae bacterium]
MFNIQKYKEIREKIEKNKLSSSIVAISKNHPKESVLEAIGLGIRIFGENRVMEAKQKFEEIIDNQRNIELHLTGPLQSNKVKKALDLFSVLHTIDREKIVNELSKYKNKLLTKKLFVQVNTGKEHSKSGIYPEQLKDFLYFCKHEKEINIFGLMCIPPIDEPPKIHFKILKKLATDNNLNDLSIGMSNDYDEALNFNPKYIRLGTILFGSRNET